MDKNMINIDDLFKQRLTGGEEKERPGAWLKMRDLLDKEMPVKKMPPPPGSSTNWRRMFGYLTILLLTATATVGSYKAITAINEDDTNKGPVAASQQMLSSEYTSNENAPVAATNKATVQEYTQDDAGNVAANNHAAKDGVNDAKNEGSLVGFNNKKQQNRNGLTVAASKEVNGRTATNNHTVTVSTENVAGKSTNRSIVNDRKVVVDNRTSKGTNKSEKVKNTANSRVKNTASTGAIAKEVTGNKAETNNTIASNNKSTSNGNSSKNATSHNATTNTTPQSNDKTGNIVPAAAAKVTAGAGKKDIKTPVQVNTEKVVTDKTVINKIETKERYDRKTGWRKDTIATGKVELEREKTIVDMNTVGGKDNLTVENNTIVAASTKMVPTSNKVVPASSIAMNAKEEENTEKIVPLSDYRVDRKNSNYQTTNLFEEMVKNAKMQLGTMKFYPGIVAGVNSSFGKHNLNGFQVGATGTLSLNERWAIFGELKYMHRFNSHVYSSERFIDNIQSGPSQQGQQYTYDIVTPKFQYSTVSSMELPVAIKYTLSRFNLMAGVNIDYHFNIDVQDVSDKSPQISATDPAAEGSATFKMVNGVPQLTLNDFSSRMTIGTLIGLAYQLTPAIQIDARMTKSMWGNAKTTKGTQFSKDVYNLPTLQLNFNYRFSSNKYRPYRSH